MKENRLLRSKRLLNKIKHPEEDVIWLFSDEKKVDQNQKVNRRNDRCKGPSVV